MPKIKILFLITLFLFSACSKETPQLTPLSSTAVILAFGDSLTFGTGATPVTNYPAALEKLISHPVINAGNPGEETSQSMPRLISELEKNHPQLVILFLGGNDLIRKRPDQTIKNNLSEMIKKIKSTGARVVLVAAPRFSLSFAIPDFYQELSDEFNIPLDTSLPSLEEQSKYKSDMIHLNQAGYAELAKNIAQLLEKSNAIPATTK
ncbi:MAG: GDSL-type esterase/lipase family protein [Gammaproteobacteria bacterium]|nr:GDSL-type esterase/lipase family protein [Gammaproteobacteria bacterium]